jgi:hypothetical protein
VPLTLRGSIGSSESGAIAEMLHLLLGYVTGAGIDARSVVPEGNEDFFRATKRLHHLLHGRRQDYLAPRRLTQELDLIQRLTG